jgi:hypothetical protein
LSRTLLIGDVHGCADELRELGERVGVSESDRVWLVGDLVVRGPDPHGVMAWIRAIGARSVRGNHEARLLRWRRLASGELEPQGRSDRALLKSEWLARCAAALSDEDWAALEALPLWLRVPEHELLVVHAGLEPGLPVEEQREHVLLHCRTVDDGGRPSDLRDGGAPWGSRYQGPPHVVFGHNALEEPQLHAWATGIDTGCVYGGALTALVLEDGQAVPPPADRRCCLVSVKARRRYFDG